MSVDGARRTEILDTAAALFASSGLKTSLKEIADACGILPGSLYHHFDSKEAIIVELIERYREDLDAIADAALARLTATPDRTMADRVIELGDEIAGCALRHRAALLLTFYEPPSGASEELVRVAQHTPMRIETAVLETLRAGRTSGELRPDIDLEAFADRLCQVMLHISLGVLQGVPGADKVPELRCRILLEGIATTAPTDRRLDDSRAMAAAQQVVRSWDEAEEATDERLTMLRSVARTEFGRRGYEATTVRDIAAAAGMSTGSVYRLIGSKDELLATIMQSFVVTMRDAWKAVLSADATPLEKLDALVWIDINAVDRFSDEYNIQLAWLRESPPTTTNLGGSFTARLRELKAVLAEGVRSGELQLDGPTADLRAWTLFELLWMPENLVGRIGPPAALTHVRDTVLRGALVRR